MPQKLSIIIPAYNEGKTIHFILDKIQKVELLNQMQKEIVIVDDCSKDETSTAIESYIDNNPNVNIQLFKHYVNKGKGAAFGIVVWFIVGTIFKKKIIPEGNMSLFNKIVPMVKLLDWVSGNP